jgi:hypothetical protein
METLHSEPIPKPGRDERALFRLGALTGFAWLAQGVVNGHHLSVRWVGSTMLALSFISWIGAVYVWSRVKGRSAILHGVALIALVPLGILWGWIYLLVASHRMSQGWTGRADAGATHVGFTSAGAEDRAAERTETSLNSTSG